LDFPWLGKCGVLFLPDLYIYFGFPLARLKWRILLKSVRLPLQQREAKEFNVVFFSKFSHFCSCVRAMAIVNEEDGLA
jgi:hypothetical protein